jgi:hypothetical protein
MRIIFVYVGRFVINDINTDTNTIITKYDNGQTSTPLLF